MTILARTRTVASQRTRVSPQKSAFGVGVEPVIPSSDGLLSPPWASSVKKSLRRLRYAPAVRQSVRMWIEYHGHAMGHPNLTMDDARTIDGIVERMNAPLPRKARATRVRKASQPRPVAIVADEYRPELEPFAPTPEDRDWAENEFRGIFEDINEGPRFTDALQLAARRFRSASGEINTFIAAELDRLAALAVATSATGPADFERKRDLSEMNARECWESRGYASGFADGRDETTGYSGPLD
jgi:hypothetical protein